MATIYNKSVGAQVDKTLVLAGAEAFVYPCPYKDWEVLRVGVFFSVVANGTMNTQLPGNGTYIISPTLGPRDGIFLGLKRNNSNFPGENNEPFIGVFSSISHARLDAGSNYSTIGAYDAYVSGLRCGTLLENGVAMQPNAQPGTITILHWGVDGDSGGIYAGFMGFTFAILNKGTADQQVNIRMNTVMKNVNSTSDQDLIDCMKTVSYTNCGNTPYQVSGVPCEIPDSIFLYLPFPQASLRIHNIGTIKVR